MTLELVELWSECLRLEFSTAVACKSVNLSVVFLVWTISGVHVRRFVQNR